MEPATKLDYNHQLSLKEFPYVVRWSDHRCTRCGRCTAVCPVKAIEPSVRVRRTVYSEGPVPTPESVRKINQVVEQVTDVERYCTGCGTCTLVCPNDAIEPEFNPQNKFLHYKNKGGEGYKRGGRRNDPGVSTLDRLKFTRISMLTDPALDA
jgi:glutamate synthase (NADPH/NADH) large chain